MQNSIVSIGNCGSNSLTHRPDARPSVAAAATIADAIQKAKLLISSPVEVARVILLYERCDLDPKGLSNRPQRLHGRLAPTVLPVSNGCYRDA